MVDVPLLAHAFLELHKAVKLRPMSEMPSRKWVLALSDAGHIGELFRVGDDLFGADNEPPDTKLKGWIYPTALAKVLAEYPPNSGAQSTPFICEYGGQPSVILVSAYTLNFPHRIGPGYRRPRSNELE
jgi:hypothetical protein